MQETEKENEQKRIKGRSPSPGVKSTAVVKYSSVQCPVDYARLQCNTDLNLPPTNWSAAIDSYGLKQILSGEAGLSSFRMAHMFPDCVGDVDLISGAECIKRLLKLPYHPNGTVSMMVHRVENTLLLDDFQIYDYLMKSEWSWLKDFFYENILKTMSEQERMTLRLPNNNSALQLTSKFLVHSIASLPELEGKRELQPAKLPVCLDAPYLPEPETRSDPPNSHAYNRNVLWTFEDIHMLIGSDLPIFGGNDRPCVSLRLRDAREPINVLTGIDYWLDNLMCNVPEVLMCYHLDGIVQKYEPMKTEDLPHMENSRFSPKVIRNVAQNILSFLKSNATKAGHTYWLFKGPHDDVVKLYDLTSLCPDPTDNPFTTPVAMLLYRVARNMRLTNRTKHVKELLENAIKLLKVERYPQIVASSHYILADLYLPAATNPADPDFKDETSADSDLEEDFMCERDGSMSRALALHDIGHKVMPEPSLCTQRNARTVKDNIVMKPAHHKDQKAKLESSPGLGSEPPARCGRALQHAMKGLEALHLLTIDKCKEEERERLKQQIIIEEQHPNMANPCEPIRMEYEPIRKESSKPEPKEHQSRSRRKKKDRERKLSERDKNYAIETSTVDKNAILIRKKNAHPLWNEPNRNDNFAWKLHLKTLLYEKICLSYATLAEHSYSHEQYGFSLKYIKMASKCQRLLSNMIIKSTVVDESCLLGRLGDNYFQMGKNWGRMDQYRRQYETDHEIDSKLMLEIDNDLEEEVEGEILDGNMDLDMNLPDSQQASFAISVARYRAALSLSRSDAARRRELRRRLASVLNDQHVEFMRRAQQIFTKYVELTEECETDEGDALLREFNELSKSSWACLVEATEIFESVDDVPNLALLYCNQGRYMRFKVHCDKTPFDSEKRALYSKAEDLYIKALKLAGSESGVGELVNWELSSHLYTKACLLQDEPNVYTVTEVTSVSEALKQALKYCQTAAGPRQYLYQFRAAMIYHRLASLYHSQFRQTTEDGPRRRSLFNLTRTNYEQAANMFAILEDANMFLTARMEHVALLETYAALSPNIKLKSLQTALQLLRQCYSIMKIIHEKEPEEKEPSQPADVDPKTDKNEFNLLSLFENRLNFILKSVIQYCRSKSNKDYEKMTCLYKKFYSASLKIKKDEDVRLYAKSICDTLTSLEDIEKENV